MRFIVIMMRAKGILTVLLLLVSVLSTAQNGYEIGGFAGVSYYFGDLNTSYSLSKPGLSLGLSGRYNFNNRLASSVSLGFGQIKGSDENSTNFFQRNRNLDFHSNIYDLNMVFEFNFFPYIHGNVDYFYTPYIFGGLAFTKFNPTTTLNDVRYSLRDYGTEGQFIGEEYLLFTAGLSFGGGVKWDINRDLSLNVFISGRKVFTDYLDDVSTIYPDFASLDNLRGPEAVLLSNRALDPEFATPGMQRGNGKKNDMIYFFNIGIMKYFGTLPCPAISNP